MSNIASSATEEMELRIETLDAEVRRMRARISDGEMLLERDKGVLAETLALKKSYESVLESVRRARKK